MTEQCVLDHVSIGYGQCKQCVVGHGAMCCGSCDQVTVEVLLMVFSTRYVQVFVDGTMVKSSELFSEEQSLVELKVWHHLVAYIMWFPATPVLDSAHLLQPHVSVHQWRWCNTSWMCARDPRDK